MIVGVNGTAGSGKDTVAGYMKKYKFAQIAFADPVKRVAMEVYAFTKDQLWGPSEKRNAPDTRYPRMHGPFVDGVCACCGCATPGISTRPDFIDVFTPPCYLTPRFALQTLGTEWGRGCYGDTWAAKGLRTAQTLLKSGYRYSPEHGLSEDPSANRARGVVISDLRFRNEMSFVRDRSIGPGVLLRVKRPGEPRTANSGHASEAEQLDVADSAFDAVILNDGTLDELYAKVDRFMEELGCQM